MIKELDNRIQILKSTPSYKLKLLRQMVILLFVSYSLAESNKFATFKFSSMFSSPTLNLFSFISKFSTMP